MNDVNDFWRWISNDYPVRLYANKTLYNSSLRETYSNFDSYVNDATTILIGHPILRQLRVENSNTFCC